MGQRGPGMHLLKILSSFWLIDTDSMGEGGHPTLEHRESKVFQKGKLVPQNEKVEKKALASHDILQFLNFQITFLPPSAKRKAMNKKNHHLAS